MALMNQITISISDKKLVAKNTWEITFQCLEAGNLNIGAGQYMRLVIPEIAGGARENSRVFSAILTPLMFRFPASKHFGVVFRESPSAFKQYLINAPIGTQMLAYGPFGDFVLPKQCLAPKALNIGWVAGGVGIAPFVSMARYANEEKLPYRITLFYANADKESAAYLSELTELERQNPNFSVRLKFGAVDKKFLISVLNARQNVARSDLQQYEKFDNNNPRSVEVGGGRPDLFDFIYIAGPTGMVNEVKKILAETGVGAEKIKCEIFG